MSEEFESVDQGLSLSWSETWIKALTQPSVETFEEIICDPNASNRRAYNWVFVSALISYIVAMLVVAVTGVSMTGSVEGAGFNVLTLICCAPVGGLLAVLGLAISAGITQTVASMLCGTGSYDKLVYANAAYIAPLSLVSGLLSYIPIIRFLTVPLGLYGIVLNVMAVKAVNRFSWGKAVSSSVPESRSGSPEP